MNSRDHGLLNGKDEEQERRIDTNANRTHFFAFFVGLIDRDGAGEGVGAPGVNDGDGVGVGVT